MGISTRPNVVLLVSWPNLSKHYDNFTLSTHIHFVGYLTKLSHNVIMSLLLVISSVPVWLS